MAHTSERAAGAVLPTLAAAQFLMTLDSSVMNVSIATVAKDVGAALILPAVVALVASNFAPVERPRAYGPVASAGAIAVAAGPLIGGLCTTYLTWRVVFFGEVAIVLAILFLLTRRLSEASPESERGSTWWGPCCRRSASG